VDRQVPRGPIAAHIDDEDLFQQLIKRIRGQDDAMRLLARQVRRHLARRTPRRPLTLMALGPTGVGKTASAEYLPIALQGRLPGGANYGHLRLDMSEYQERHRVSQLLGAPQGYLGHDEGAQLINTLRINPRTIVLFDEIEKAHADILRALMNAMDAGRLSSAVAAGGGHEIDCRRSMFIFTSNLDAAGVLKTLNTRNAFGDRSTVDAVCRSHLRAAGVAPELIGRIGCFLVFRPLGREARAEIATLAITRVAEEYGVRIARIEPTVVADILKASPDEGFGARPDEYLIDELLGACLAEASTAGLEQPALLEAGPPYRCVPLDRRAAL
jgi:ATP-dependent Clp protease ATP-binding subunit ClpA